MSQIPALPDLAFAAVAPQMCGLEGNRMCFMRAGSNRRATILLLHGIGSNSAGWRFVLNAMARDYDVIAWNAPGYMLSDNLASPTPTNWQYADAAAALLDALGIDSVFLAGSSFGSMIAASFAARHAKRVRRLALLGCSRGLKSLPETERTRSLDARKESIRDGALSMSAKRWQNLIAPNASETAKLLTQEALKATNPRGFLQAAETINATDIVEFVGDITAPALVIVGKEDKINPPEISRVVADGIANSRLVELDGAGHLPKLECPDKVVRLLSEHFGQAL
jgi:pimeloyl-ACP methyl ester carboxylesterase